MSPECKTRNLVKIDENLRLWPCPFVSNSYNKTNSKGKAVRDEFLNVLDEDWNSLQNKSFDEVIPNFPNDLLYLDPPYYMKKDSDNKMFKGIYPNSNFAVHHNEFDHELLRDLIHSHKGSFIISYNNCETIREYYKDFKQVFPNWMYSYGQGETRIGKNRKEGKITKESHEILIIKE